MPAFAPLSFTVMRGSTIVRGSIGARSPAPSAPSCIGTPAATSLAIPKRNARTPSAPLRSSATARCGRPFKIRLTSALSTEPGPTSTKVRMPAACIASISSTKRTGSAICAASAAPTSAPCGAALALE